MTRGRRLAAQVLALPALWLVANIDIDVYLSLVSLALVLVWPVSVAVAVLLVYLARAAEADPESDAPVTLVEAADNAVTLALVATGLTAAAVVTLARIFGFELQGRPVLVLLGWALVLVGVPAVSWVRTLRRVWLPMLARRRR